MKPYRAYLVLGGESTGTRLMTSILVRCGCAGNDGHEQYLDDGAKRQQAILASNRQPFVWRRSIPHSKQWVDIEKRLIHPLTLLIPQEEICIIVMTRNWLAAAKSAVNAGHVHNIGQAIANLQKAYVDIFSDLGMYPKIDYHLVSYDFLVRTRDVYLKYLLKNLKLTTYHHDLGNIIYDGNERHIWEAIDEQAKQSTKD